MDKPSTKTGRAYSRYGPYCKKMEAVQKIVRKIKSKKEKGICLTPKEILLDYVINNKTNDLKTLFNAKLLKYRYSDPEYNNYSVDILSIACALEEVEAETVKCLIELGADIRCRDVDYFLPFHYVKLRTDNKNVLKVITDELKNRKFNLEILDDHDQIAEGNISPNETIDDPLEETDPKDFLFKLVKNKEEHKFLNCKGEIISEYANSDNGEMTLLQFACKNRTERIVKLLLEKGADKNIFTSSKRETPLQIAAEHDFYGIFEILIKEYKNDEEIPKYVISQFLPRLLQHYDSTEIKNKSSCDLLLKKIKANKHSYDLNERKEVTGYTPLHYAARYADTATVINLLDIGASLVCRNHSGFMPVQYLDPEQLEAVLDNCVQGDSFKRNVEDFEVSINFRALLPKKVETKNNNDQLSSSTANNNDSGMQNEPNNADRTTESTSLLNPNNSKKSDSQSSASVATNNDIEIGIRNVSNKGDTTTKATSLLNPNNSKKSDSQSSASVATNNDIERGIRNVPNKGDTTTKATSLLNPNNSNESDIVYETDLVFYMSKVSELKHLLKHPVIVSFLYMKWHRTRWIFWMNLTFYLTCCAFLVLHVFFGCTTLWWILLFTCFMLILREIFQYFSLPEYFTNVENWMALSLIGLVILILSNMFSINTKKAFSSMSMLLAGLKLILMVGQHPNLSTNLVILRTVSYNFFKFLLCYLLLILAFPLSFYIIFTEEHQQPSANNTEENNNDSFANPGMSLFKTVVMLTGELDASNINFRTSPIIGRLIFIIFIFIVVIILLNLLNSLAVSDTQMIRNDAELISYIERVRYIRYIEMIFGDSTQNLLYRKIKFIAEKSYLLSHLQITVLPNQNGQIKEINNLHLDQDTVQRIKDIIRTKVHISKE
ncbi:uncharacterized protein [Diabrotica undecimpunctata]|uniref:uncharacterized protein isoform X2 n=1 Tax=Diabrotica undecimpunctata TaxID=50387 RepID=UPI003B637E8A